MDDSRKALSAGGFGPVNPNMAFAQAPGNKISGGSHSFWRKHALWKLYANEKLGAGFEWDKHKEKSITQFCVEHQLNPPQDNSEEQKRHRMLLSTESVL